MKNIRCRNRTSNWNANDGDSMQHKHQHCTWREKWKVCMDNTWTGWFWRVYWGMCVSRGTTERTASTCKNKPWTEKRKRQQKTMKTRQETASQWYNSNKYNEEKLTRWDVWRISFTWGMILTWIVGAMSACSEQQWTYTQGPNTAERLHNANYDLSGNTRLILRQVQKVRWHWR